MDQQRRLLTFTVLSFLILFGWMSVGPKLFPGMFPPPVKQVEKKAVPKEEDAEKAEVAQKDQDGEQPDAPLEDAKLPEHPTRIVVLGSEDSKTGFGLKVSLSSVGAGIVSAELNDPRYKALKARKHGAPVPQLSLLGNNLHDELQPLKTSPPVTGHLSVQEVDQRLAKLDKNADLRQINWNVAEITEDADVKGVNASATFSFMTPDGRWELRKKFALLRWENAIPSRDDDPAGYQLAMQLSFKNLSNDEQTVVYDLQGPVGVPLENAEHTSKYRDVKYGFRNASGNFTTGAVTTGEVVKAFDKNQLEELKPGERTFQYVGLDTQYFAALVLPQDVANKQPNYVDFAKAQVVEKNVALPNWSELSLQLHSVECAVPAETELRHDYRLYLGPKRTALLARPGSVGLPQNGLRLTAL